MVLAGGVGDQGSGVVPALGDFMTGAVAWLERVAPAHHVALEDRPVFLPGAADGDYVARAQVWQRALFDGGYAGLGWPVEHGGRGLPHEHQVAFAEASRRAGVPGPVNVVGEAIAGPVLMTHGTSPQRDRYLPVILRGDEIWCQLFSEPDAGSDVAAVRTTASPTGDAWRIDGRKVWATSAAHARRGLLLARTDATASWGFTCFVLDMTRPGVAVREIRQMTGGSSFAEVTMDGVLVDDADRVGAVGRGLAVAAATLAAERAGIGAGLLGVTQQAVAGLVADGLTEDANRRQHLASLTTRSRMLTWLSERSAADRRPTSLVAKLTTGQMAGLADEVLDGQLGAHGMLTGRATELRTWLPAITIAGGTDEVVRTMVGERLLGLPREPA